MNSGNKINLIVSSNSNNVIAHFKNLVNGGNVFVLYRNKYNENGDIIESLFDEIEKIENNGLTFINCIVSPIPTNSNFCDNVLYILWFTNNIDKHIAYKDNIREKSIWKDVEWGKREKNYNKKGKDPGNVWIPTEDDGKGNITDHLILGINDIFKRIVEFSTKPGDVVYHDLHLDFSYDSREIIRLNNEYKINLNPITYIVENLQTQSKEQQLFSKVIFESSEKMSEVADSSIKCMVTSPPYWDIKNYYKNGQIGKESYETYQKRITSVWSETIKKIDERGSIWININTIFKHKKMIPIPTDIIKNCLKIGLHFKSCIIWHKSSAIPTRGNNLCDHFEYVLVFTKTNKWYINLDNVNYINDYKNHGLINGSIWNINRKAGIIGKNYIHPAIFPLELIERIVDISSLERDVIMDPFLGSGTSLIAALNKKRSFIGYEYYEGFKNLIQYRIDNECKNHIETQFITKEEIVDDKIFR